MVVGLEWVRIGRCGSCGYRGQGTLRTQMDQSWSLQKVARIRFRLSDFACGNACWARGLVNGYPSSTPVEEEV